jgi:hypothetical protein
MRFSSQPVRVCLAEHYRPSVMRAPARSMPWEPRRMLRAACGHQCVSETRPLGHPSGIYVFQSLMSAACKYPRLYPIMALHRETKQLAAILPVATPPSAQPEFATPYIILHPIATLPAPADHPRDLDLISPKPQTCGACQACHICSCRSNISSFQETSGITTLLQLEPNPGCRQILQPRTR